MGIDVKRMKVCLDGVATPVCRGWTLEECLKHRLMEQPVNLPPPAKPIP